MGRAKEVVGWATGDREVEAKGRLEKEVADPGNEHDEVTAPAVEDAKHDVRADHQEVEP